MSLAAVLPGRTIARKLPLAATIYTAELRAMLVAVARFIRSSQSWFTIYSDSVSATQGVCNSFSTHPLVKQIHLWLTLLKNKHKRVMFCWVPSHIGVAGNKAADRATREAHDPILSYIRGKISDTADPRGIT